MSLTEDLGRGRDASLAWDRKLEDERRGWYREAGIGEMASMDITEVLSPGSPSVCNPPVVLYVDELVDGWCNLNIAPGTALDALHDLAARIGLRRDWFYPDIRPELAFYRITTSKRAQALAAGAVYKPGMEQAREARAAWKARGELENTP